MVESVAKGVNLAMPERLWWLYGSPTAVAVDSPVRGDVQLGIVRMDFPVKVASGNVASVVKWVAHDEIWFGELQ